MAHFRFLLGGEARYFRTRSVVVAGGGRDNSGPVSVGGAGGTGTKHYAEHVIVTVQRLTLVTVGAGGAGGTLQHDTAQMELTNQASARLCTELVEVLEWVKTLMAVLVVALEDYRAWTVAVVVVLKETLPPVIESLGGSPSQAGGGFAGGGTRCWCWIPE